MARRKLTDLQRRIYRFFINAKNRSANHNIKFNLTREYLEAIVTTHCPIFGVEFDWRQHKLGKRKTAPNAPELDRIVADDGYIIGNVVFICGEANRIKQHGTMQQHYQIADFIYFKLKERDEEYAKQKQSASVPTTNSRKGEDDSSDGTIPTARIGEDDNDAHHHCGTISGEDADHRTQEGGGISMGIRAGEVGAPLQLDMFKDTWQ